jgi:dephospho-CoA kinase
MTLLLGIVGLNGSGKETLAEYLVLHHNFIFNDIGQEIRDELKAAGRNHLDRDEMIRLGNEKRQKFGLDYWCKKALNSVNSKDVVITSIRNLGEVEEILSRGGVIVEVFADQKTRFDRTVERVRSNPGKHGDVGSFGEFKAREMSELRNPDPHKQQLLDCIEAAKYKVNNNGSRDQLYKGIEGLMAQLKADANP